MARFSAMLHSVYHELADKPVGEGVTLDDRFGNVRVDAIHSADTAAGGAVRDSSEHPGDTRERAARIRAAITAEEVRLRRRWAVLDCDDAVGTAFFLASVFAMVWGARAYATGSIGATTAFLVAALATSTLHELEHDTIHELYFKKRCRWMQDVFFLGIQLGKLGSSPWWRKEIHLWHHLHSGGKFDVEERLIGLGMPWGWRRVLLTLTPPLGSLLAVPDIMRDEPTFRWFQMAVRGAFGTTVMLILLAGAVLNAAGPLLPCGPVLMGAWSTAARVGGVCWLLPNMVRQSALQLVSSCEHYYGDIPARDVFFQTQVLTAPITWPAQIFCWFFGATHIVHHYAVRQPFYLRTLVFLGVVDVLRREGVRFNDFGSVSRSNRWAARESGKSPESVQRTQNEQRS